MHFTQGLQLLGWKLKHTHTGRIIFCNFTQIQNISQATRSSSGGGGDTQKKDYILHIFRNSGSLINIHVHIFFPNSYQPSSFLFQGPAAKSDIFDLASTITGGAVLALDFLIAPRFFFLSPEGSLRSYVSLGQCT